MKKAKQTQDELYVVGIGASAGGLEALQKLFKAIPEDTGMAFVVVQHLSPDFISMMPELLGKHTQMAIYTAEDKMTIEPNCIYLNRRNKNLHVKGRQLYLLDIGPKHNLNLPIDIFFHTLGEEFKEKSIGIILSGTGSDGSRGIKTIKGAGGIVMVQTPESAQFDGMPNSAIATNTVDFMLPPEEMADVLAKIPLEKLVFAKKEGAPVSNEMLLKHILDEIHAYSGLDFNQYKPNTIQRRLANRLKILNFDTLKEYLEYLRINKNEKEQLKKDFLIGVTQFFRDPQAFNSIRKSIIPAICNSKKATDTIRIWSAGCSTGEEAYSLAILFDEYIRMQKLNVDFKIFATDAEPTHVQTASEGIYYINSISEIERKYLEQYFVKSGDKIQIIKRIREKIVFSRHNLATDPPFIKMDLISCRNLLIYIDIKLQEKILQTLLFSMNKFGYLFLGNSESLPKSLNSAFSPVDVKWKIFQSIADGKYIIPAQKKQIFPQNKTAISENRTIPYYGNRFKEKLETKIYKYLSKKYSPDAVIIDSNFEILFISGNAGELLSLREGVFQMNLLDKLEPGMTTLIRNAVRRMNKEGKDITLKKSVVRKHDKTFLYDITLHKIEDIPEMEGACLIQFSQPREITGEQVEITQFKPNQLTQLQIKELEDELQFTKTELQNTMEELETSNEELQASNEELMASNEELQSTNEELQSVNEELYTVNTELQEKNKELQYVNDELNNLLNSTDIAVLYLDGNLNIRKFTPELRIHFDLHENDIGRPITNFASGFEEEDRLLIIDNAKNVMEKLIPSQKEIKSKKGKYYIKRIHPFLTGDKKVDGVIISFIEITKLKEQEKELIAAKEKAEESERLKTAFLANMSHEIRTPMNGILGFLNLLKEPDLNAGDKNKFIEIVNQSGERLLQTVNSIVEISKIDAGAISVELSKYNLSEELRQQYNLFKVMADKKNIQFVLHLPENDIWVQSDRTKTESILTNLIGNAIKYTDKGKVELKLENKKDKILLSVIDTGVGISPSEQSLIFERFRRAEDQLTSTREGSGLGLSITKSYVEMLGGKIEVESAPRKGSTFRVSFKNNIVVPYQKEKQKQKSSKLKLKNKLDGRTILVVEDDDIGFSFLQQVLKPWDCNILRAFTGKEAVSICRGNTKIDIVLMDIQLPEMNGLEATSEILKIAPGLPVIAQTAYAFADDKEKALASGCVDYIAKPIRKDELLEKIVRHVKN